MSLNGDFINSEIPSEKEEIIIKKKTIHKVGTRLICIHVTVQDMDILNQNVIINIISINFSICPKNCIPLD